MSIWLQKIQTPKKLILAWESPLTVKDRSRWAVGEASVRGEHEISFRYYDCQEISEHNGQRTCGDLLDSGFLGYPAFKLKWGAEFSGRQVADAFKRRLPAEKRADFRDFTDAFRIAQSAEKSLPTLLAVTGGRQANDGFSFVDPLEHTLAESDLLLEVTGCRHYLEAVRQCTVGEAVKFSPEPDNKFDPDAIKVECKGNVIGYVNRIQTKGMLKAIQHFPYHAEIVRWNGTSERPRLYTAVKFRDKQTAAAA
tara:strand:- start:595 stop:1350 length:756 start_codon:yes stop_codon:yes gene_type:complete